MSDRKAQPSSDDQQSPGAPALPPNLASKLGAEALKKEHGTAEDKTKTDPGEDTQSPLLENVQTDAAVEDIVRDEGDELLHVQDQATTHTSQEPPKRKWWRTKAFRWTVVCIVLLGIAGAISYPASRYAILNTAGVRAKASVIVTDDTTGLALRNVTVKLGGKTTQTDSDGKAVVSGLRLGPHSLRIERRGFSEISRTKTIGWGSNPLGTFKLKAVGVQYILNVHDFLSGKPIERAEASSGDATARSDKNGKITLTIEDSDAAEIAATFSAPGYRNEQVSFKADTTAPVEVGLVTAAKAVFVSKESGTYDVYSMDIDGKNKKVLLAGTGRENANISLSVSPSGERAALISTRDDKRAADGMLLSTLTLINVMDSTSVTLEQADQAMLIDWIGERLVYQISAAGQSDLSDTRQRIISYDYKTNSRAQLGAANQFEAAASVGGVVYYSPTPTSEKDKEFIKIKPDGSSKQTILTTEVWSIYRTAYDELSLQTGDGWYRVVGDEAPVSSAAPSNPISRVYTNSRAAPLSIWKESDMLKLYDISHSKDTTVHTQSGLAYPLRWLSDSAVMFRVVSGGETADYVMSLDGGSPRKVMNVTNTYGPTPAY